MLTEAYAYRTDGLITVELIGQTPTPYDEAEIVGYYPGTVMRSADPGSAQIYIREGRKPEFENMHCPPLLGKIWIFNPVIQDHFHKTVEIFINDCFVRQIRVIEHTVTGMYNIIDL
jgi:hypothetical protein